MPQISVIVPVYNVEKYLSRCIDSILNQTFSDFELILVDDGSPDQSGKICDEYALKDSRVKVIHKKNGGVSAARNTGIDEAVGEYIMFVDSDDYIDENMLSDMMIHNGVDAIFCGFTYVDKMGNKIKKCSVKDFCAIEKPLFIEKHYMKCKKNYIISGPCNKIFKTEVIKRNNVKFDETISICEDGSFVMNALQYCKTFSNIGASYYNYVQYGENTLMHKYNANAIESAEILYSAHINFFRGDKNEDVLKLELNKDSLTLFMNFFSQIYSRSQMSNKDKYIAAKAAFKNKTFKELLNSSGKKTLKMILMKVAAKSKWVFPVHALCSLYWARKLKG